MNPRGIKYETSSSDEKYGRLMAKFEWSVGFLVILLIIAFVYRKMNNFLERRAARLTNNE